MGKSQGITYGKVNIFSDTEELTKLESMLNRILKRHGYPEQERDDGDEYNDDEDEFDEVGARKEEDRVSKTVEEPWKNIVENRENGGEK